MGRPMLDSSIWLDEDFGSLSFLARLLLVGMTSNANNRGQISAHTRFLCNRIFAYDAIEESELEKALSELEVYHFIEHCIVDGKARYQVLRGFDNQDGFVYVAFDGRYYKVGFSIHPQKRMYQVKRDTGLACEIVLLIKTPDYRSLEAELHERFDHKRISGEWFDLDADDLDWITSVIASDKGEANNG